MVSSSRFGLRKTAAAGVQLRVPRDQRSGFLRRARSYDATAPHVFDEVQVEEAPTDGAEKIGRCPSSKLGSRRSPRARRHCGRCVASRDRDGPAARVALPALSAFAATAKTGRSMARSTQSTDSADPRSLRASQPRLRAHCVSWPWFPPARLAQRIDYQELRLRHWSAPASEGPGGKTWTVIVLFVAAGPFASA